MKFKEIKPGMVIHCPKEEDAEALLEHLRDIGYTWAGGSAIPTGDEAKLYFFDEEDIETAYRTYQGGTGLWVAFDTVDAYISRGYNITEFSNLIESEDNLDNNLDNPQDNEMSVRELLEWFHNADADTIYKVFGISRLDEALAYYEPNEIIRRIEQHEAAKKAPKPVKVKEGYYCDIYTEDEQILNYIMYGVDEQTAKNDAREKAMQNTRETGSRTFADVKFVCEEDES